MAADVTLTGAVDDIRGLGIAVYQDHGAVRIDVAGIEIALDRPAVYKLGQLLSEAANDAAVWGTEHEGDGDA